jgi:hypothetical protein
MMKNLNEIVVTIRLNCELSLWQAIKLRIAGKKFTNAVAKMLNKMKGVSDGTNSRKRKIG